MSRIFQNPFGLIAFSHFETGTIDIHFFRFRTNSEEMKQVRLINNLSIDWLIVTEPDQNP